MGCYALQPAETGIGPLTSEYTRLQATNCNSLKPQRNSPPLHHYRGVSHQWPFVVHTNLTNGSLGLILLRSSPNLRGLPLHE